MATKCPTFNSLWASSTGRTGWPSWISPSLEWEQNGWRHELQYELILFFPTSVCNNDGSADGNRLFCLLIDDPGLVNSWLVYGSLLGCVWRKHAPQKLIPQVKHSFFARLGEPLLQFWHFIKTLRSACLGKSAEEEILKDDSKLGLDLTDDSLANGSFFLSVL